MAQRFDLVIVGGGILGVSLSYFASFLNPGKKIAVVEQEHRVAFHTSGRNTGKVHAPYLYHPVKKRSMARAALCGFDMWETYAREKGLPFKRDGVLEVSLDAAGTKTLEKYLRWGIRNGLTEDDIELVTAEQLGEIEPAVRCHSALRVHRDGSADYAAFTDSLMRDSRSSGVELLLGMGVIKIARAGDWEITLDGDISITAGFVINAAGGRAVDIAHSVGVAEDLTDVHFRGEYWRAPHRHRNLTRTSVYSVPDFPEYPFLDPHWIIRVDGSCEIGPNAVPVFSPYGYDRAENVRRFVPKVLEMLGSGARKAIFDRRFRELALNEIQSSISKPAMVERVRRFLPALNADEFTQRGTAGIRSSVIDDRGRFLPEAVLVEGESSLHILNYNSPGATGALPFVAQTLHMLSERGHFVNQLQDARCGPWKFGDILERIL